MRQKIFQSFPPVSKQDWVDQAKKDLKGGNFELQLVSVAPEGFPIHPYYAIEDTVETQWIKAFDHQINPSQQVPGLPPRHWVNVVEIAEADETAANQEIQLVLNSGADGLILTSSEAWDWSKALAGLVLPSVAIWIKPLGEDPLPVLESFSSWLDQQDLSTSDLWGGILWDGLHVAFDRPLQIETSINQLYTVHRLFQSHTNFKSVCLNSTIYGNAGGTAVQELGYGLAALVELWDGLTEKGLEPKALFSDLFVLTAVGTDYFMEIAKLKAFRIALYQLAKQYQIEFPAEDILLFAMTSRWSQSANEPYNNLLRHTTEAMSAIIGGCNAIFVAPHDHSSSFTKRMARNIPILLREEGYFDKTLDPAAGSYYIENLIRQLFEEGWELLAKTEQEGGWWKLYLKHKIQLEVKASRGLKFQHLMEGAIERLGTPKAVDHPISVKPLPEEEDYQLKPCSHFLPYESSL